MRPPSDSHLSVRATLGLVAVAGCLAAGRAPAQPAQATGEAVSPAARSAWAQFRNAHPYHIQVVALGDPDANGSRVLVVSEPPPDVTLADIVSELPAVVRRYGVARHQMGYDGWVRDFVAELPALPPTALRDLAARIHRRLFGTTYKASVVPIVPTTTPTATLDLTVTAAELRRWLITDQETFGRSEMERVALPALLRTGATGVYYSTGPGLVALLLPRRADISPMRRAIRMFALDGDLIVGAIAGERSVAVVARERRVDPELLPPLRTETVLQLAGAGTDHLAQSYERNFPLAGRYSDSLDWAPIYLSPTLIDTEYGSLLNITDQLLKSWSEAGTIRYVRFDYPTPSSYPFGRPLHDVIHASSVTFNWNTKGAGYAADRNGLSVYALNRTGALPVSYFAGSDDRRDQTTVRAEDQGYAYFAGVNDPNLARVVQYAALYQAFRAFDVRAAVPAPAPLRDAATSLVAFTRAAIDRLITIQLPSAAEVTSPADRAQLRLATETQDAVRALRENGGDEALDRLATLLLNQRKDEASRRAELERLRLLYERVLLRNGEVNPNASRADRTEYAIQSLLPSVSRDLPSFLRQSERDYARSQYVLASRRADPSWIRTASIVQSWGTGESANWVGGHNLDAAITRFEASPSMAPGRVRVLDRAEGRVIVANGADVPRLSGILRRIATEPDPARLETAINRSLADLPPAIVRTRLTALPFAPRPVGSPRGLEPLASRHVGFFPRAVSNDVMRGDPFITITKSEAGEYTIAGRNGDSYVAQSVAGALEAVVEKADAGASQVHLVGFDREDAALFSRNARSTFRDRDVVGIVRERSVAGTSRAELTKRLDFSRAEIGKPELLGPRTVEGEPLVEYAIPLDVPEVGSGVDRLHMRLRVAFSEKIARPVMDAILNAIARICEALGADIRLPNAAVIIKAKLRVMFPEVKDLDLELADITIVKVTTSASQAVGED